MDATALLSALQLHALTQNATDPPSTWLLDQAYLAAAMQLQQLQQAASVPAWPHASRSRTQLYDRSATHHGGYGEPARTIAPPAYGTQLSPQAHMSPPFALAAGLSRQINSVPAPRHALNVGISPVTAGGPAAAQQMQHYVYPKPNPNPSARTLHQGPYAPPRASRVEPSRSPVREQPRHASHTGYRLHDNPAVTPQQQLFGLASPPARPAPPALAMPQQWTPAKDWSARGPATMNSPAFGTHLSKPLPPPGTGVFVPLAGSTSPLAAAGAGAGFAAKAPVQDRTSPVQHQRRTSPAVSSANSDTSTADLQDIVDLLPEEWEY